MKTSDRDTLRAHWLDRLWDELFSDGGGLVSPRQIRIDGLDQQRIRAAELATIESTEREMGQLKSGRMLRDVSGQMVDAHAVGDIPMFSIIERPPADDDTLLARVSRPDSVLRSAVEDVEQRELSHALNLRRIAILAESEITMRTVPARLGSMRPSTQWMQRWRLLAQQSFAPDLQRLWARMLVQEVASPGRYALAIMDSVAQLSERDLAGVRMLASFSFRDFIFDARQRYFQRDLHESLLKTAADLGLLRAGAKRVNLMLKPNRHGAGSRLLICNNRALQVSHLPENGIALPVIRITDIGKQIFRLCDAHADMAYLLDMAAYLQQFDAEVALGDWLARDRQFNARLNRF